MSNQEILIGNFNWDAPEEIIEGAEGKTYFAKGRLYLNLQVRRFQSGNHFTLPGVNEYHFDEATQSSTPTGNLLQFKGMTLGSSRAHMHIIVAELADKNGIEYQRVWRFNNWKDKDGDELRPNAWDQYQKAELMRLPVAKRNALADAGEASLLKNDVNAWVFFKYELLETGYTGQYEIKNYLANVVIYDDEQEWQKAEQEWRSQFNGNGGQKEDYSHYPQMWQSKPEALAKFAQKQNDAGKSHKEIATACKLLDEDGSPALTPGGTPINVVALLAEVLDVPEPMVILE